MTMLSEGTWLTRERLRVLAILSGAATLLAIIFLYATSSGTLDYSGRPLGTDFSNVWTAGKMAASGNAADAWDWAAHYRVQQAAHGSAEVDFYGWHYPPPFLMLAAALSFLPYLWALLIWQGVTLALLVYLTWSIVPQRRTIAFSLAAPVVLVCLTHGHNGFLTGALLGGGLLLLDRRPALAGVLLGCLIYKPQFGILIPPLLIAGGHWRAFLGASLSAGGLIGATLLLWGLPVWDAFISSLPLTRDVVIEAGNTGWGKIQSPFAMIRMWGGGVGLAYFVQGVISAAAIAVTCWLARNASPNLRNAAAMAAAMLSTPYVLDYDFVVLGVGCVFLIAEGLERGFLPYEKSTLALILIAPMFARSAGTLLLLPLGQATAFALLALAFRRAAQVAPLRLVLQKA
jgi:hypothetical protein